MKKKRLILHIFGQMERAGAELRTIDLMRNIDREQFQFHFCVLSGLPGELDNTIRSLGGQVHLINLYDICFPWRFLHLLRKYQFEIVYSHVHYPSGFLLWFAAITNVPKRITHFRNSSDGRGSDIWHRLERRILCHLIDRYSTHILAVSKAAMAEAWKPNWTSDKRCQVIYNGIDLNQIKEINEQYDDVRKEFGISQNANLYIHVGRLEAVKNHLRLLSIFTEIAAKDSTAHLLIVGRGNNAIEAKLRIQIQKAELAQRVIFTYVRSDIPRLLNTANMLIFPSFYEGLPGVVLEATACGLPVLASDLPITREIAAQLPSVKYLPLSATDEQWCLVAQQLCAQGFCSEARDAVTTTFENSAFTMPACVQAHYNIWQD